MYIYIYIYRYTYTYGSRNFVLVLRIPCITQPPVTNLQNRSQMNPRITGKSFSNLAENGPEVVPRWSLTGGALFPSRIILF